MGRKGLVFRRWGCRSCKHRAIAAWAWGLAVAVKAATAIGGWWGLAACRAPRTAPNRR
ncbi:MAG: hypothetical protein HC918_02895 [Oscillatoriales cyanobacterium SM2_1_8]|nr:hypothetical protein [Oscillatoriales cyanobacterium SM2_1_8]